MTERDNRRASDQGSAGMAPPELRGPGTVKAPGTIVSGKYLLVRRLAFGGMGDVYQAKHLVLGRHFALKFIRANLTGNEALLRRFRKEAETAGRLVSDHIAAVTDFDWASPTEPYLVMELLEGWDLAQVRKQGPLPAAIVAEIGRQVCRGLAVAHAQNFVHRDLKPSNLFLCRRSSTTFQVKILDFGIAKDIQAAPSLDLTSPGETLGTAHYMAPEQIRQSPSLDGRADLYALGVVLYEALSGQLPRSGGSYHSVIFHGLNQPPAPLESICSDLPAGLAAVVHRAMAYTAADRFATAQDFERALAPFSSSGSRITWQTDVAIAPDATAAPAEATRPSPATLAPAQPSPAPAALPDKGRRRPWKWIAGSAATALPILLVLLLPGRGAHQTPASNERTTGPSTPIAATGTTALAPPPVATADGSPHGEAAPLPTEVVARSQPERRVDRPRPNNRRRPVPRAAASDPRAQPPAPAGEAEPRPAEGAFFRKNPYK
jgi:serine/threonine protein kinase